MNNIVPSNLTEKSEIVTTKQQIENKCLQKTSLPSFNEATTEVKTLPLSVRDDIAKLWMNDRTY